ncbi:MAG: hypothetical protein AB8B49_01375 [Nitratireductor sp.]
MRVLVIFLLVLIAGCSQTTKLDSNATALIGRNFAILENSPIELTRSVSTQQVSTGNFAADLIVNVVGNSIRTTGKTAQKAVLILSPSFDPAAHASLEVSRFMQSKYSVVPSPNLQGSTIAYSKSAKWPDEARVSSIIRHAKNQGFGGIVFDLKTRSLLAEATGSSINKAGGNVNMNFAGSFVMIDVKQGKVIASGHCSSSLGSARLDNLISKGPLPGKLAPTGSVVASAPPPASGGVGVSSGSAALKIKDGEAKPLPAFEPEPNQQYVDLQFKQMATACANKLVKDALL